MQKSSHNIIFGIFISLIILAGCGSSSTPKPKGYFRIALPEKHYTLYAPQNCPYSFEIPDYSYTTIDSNRFNEKCWINVVFPKFHAKIHISYKDVNKNFNDFAEESRKFAYKHTVKASAINEKLINTKKGAHGILYEIGGNTASSLQFFVSDSSKHFLRGALYFYHQPNADSVAPVLDFINKDIEHLINTFTWQGAGATDGNKK